MTVITNRFMFIHIPRTGGTSIEHVIGGSGHMTYSSVVRNGRDYFGNRLPEGPIPVICFVRNPYDRLVSAFFHVKQTHDVDLPDTFGEFIDYLQDFLVGRFVHFWPQYLFVWKDAKLMATHIYRFERYQLEWARMKREMGIESTEPLTHSMPTKHDPWRTYYDSRTAEIVSRLYRKDFEVFSYSTGIEVGAVPSAEH